ncbi:dephospho-CoA kinase [Marinobacterium nitratireducens]|uniref:Dephospho-CoA kinase n=1 Tax=Marinobacterium nitratireducens TaxID=518897 RepID=A0A917ZG63_9GAMM|nr:dephospho-CoA kinase [Marinobacterium nitratireducens]GGO82488.1 dephospho-CoA kinase [Marinobacterium nitratireducens]
MFVIGLTGGIGSGKSAAAHILESQGIVCVDADIIAREVVEPGEPALERIADHFGAELLQADGSLDRARLRQIVFADPEARSWLEGLLHPLIRERIIHRLHTAKSEYALLVSPLLLETDQHSLVDHIVVVDVPEETQIARTASRDGNSREQVERIMAAQMSREDRVAKADSIIDNSGTPEALTEATLKLHQALLSLARNRSNR